MSKRRSAYENEYTKQLEEAVFDQAGYDSKKEEQKKQTQMRNMRQRTIIRICAFLSLLVVAIGAYYLINLDPKNGPPIAVFLTVVAAVAALARWINK